MSLQIGEVLDGKYKVIERLGAGGMGEVYKVEHVFLRATRVIKVIRPQISETADAHERFLREAQLATKVQHPNVATLHDFSELPDGSHYMVWEYIEGQNLAQVQRGRGVIPAGEAIRITVQALSGLEAIHRAGIIHRDISPENLMITHDNRVKIIDLGVAKAEQPGDHAVTQTGMFVGKLRYSSPEQLGFLAQGEKLDSRADLYSLGVVLFEMLTGRPPFEATSPHQYFIQYSGGTNVQPLDLSLVPEKLRPVLARALEHDRNQRFANAHEFSDALEHVGLRLPTQEDETVRVMTPLPETIRTPLPASLQTPETPTVQAAMAPTIKTPMPGAIQTPAAQTIKTPMPGAVQTPQPAAGATEYIPPPQNRGRQNAVIIAVVLVLLFGIIGAGAIGTWWYLRSRSATTAAATATSATKPQPPVEPVPQPPTATSSVTVTSAPETTTTAAAAATPATTPQTTSEAPPTPTATTASAAPPAPRTEAQRTAPPTKKAEAKPAPAKPAPRAEEPDLPAENETLPSFVEGSGSSRNDDAISTARQYLRGVSRVTVDARGDADLVKQLNDTLSGLGLTVADGADVTIRFYGKVTHLSFGRKQREAEATILKRGRPIFRYEMKAEQYRVGDNPAEAFARVLSDLFNR